MHEEKRLIAPDQVDALARVYTDFDRGFNRTHSRAAVDGGILLLALLDELRRLRQVLEAREPKGRWP